MRITPATDANNTMNRTTYSPNGVLKKPNLVRLMRDEQEDVDSLVSVSGVSRSKILRDCIVAGLPIVRAALVSPSASAVTSPTPPSEAFSSDEASASPAGLSTLAA